MILIPQDARPHEVAILHIYLTVSRDPKTIRDYLHYNSLSPVYETLRRHRGFLAEQRRYRSSTVLFATA